MQESNSQYLEKMRNMYSKLSFNQENQNSDLREIEQEENNINKIRAQREKIEQIKHEFQKKNVEIQELKLQIQELQEPAQNYQNLMKKYQNTQLEFEEIELELKDKNSKITLQNIQISKLEEQAEQKDNQIIKQKQEIERLMIFQNESDKIINQYKQKVQIKENNMLQKEKQLMQTIDLKDDNIHDLKMKIRKLEEDILDIQIKCDRADNLEKLNSKLKLQLNQTEIKKENSEKIIQDMQEQTLQLLKQGDQRMLILQNDYNELQVDLEKQLGIISRQEKVIKELQKKRKNDDVYLEKLESENKFIQKEFQKCNDLKNKMQEEYNQMYLKFQKLDENYQEQKQQNKKLQQKLKKMIQQQENDKKIREELEKVKQGLQQERNIEVSKIDEICDLFVEENSKGSQNKLNSYQNSQFFQSPSIKNSQSKYQQSFQNNESINNQYQFQ